MSPSGLLVSQSVYAGSSYTIGVRQQSDGIHLLPPAEFRVYSTGSLAAGASRSVIAALASIQLQIIRVVVAADVAAWIQLTSVGAAFAACRVPASGAFQLDFGPDSITLATNTDISVKNNSAAAAVIDVTLLYNQLPV